MALSFIKRVFTFGKDAPPQEDKDTPELTPAAAPAIEPEPAAEPPVAEAEVLTQAEEAFEEPAETVADSASDTVEDEEPALLPDVEDLQEVGVVPLSLL